MRERLLEAAMALAAEQGFEACGLREIAARAGVSPAMIAYYFGGREGLVEALYARAFERVSRRTRDFLERPDFSQREDGLGTLVRLYVAALTAEPWLPRLIASELLAHGASPLRSRLFGDLTRGPLMAMIGWLEAEQRAGRLRADVDARRMAISVAGLCIFPFLIQPIVGDALGMGTGVAFAEALVAHAEQILADGLLVRAKKEAR
ncbi:MAG: TetR family transcriptional regulator [Holophagales bacterium]|nr:TetR family transcriptional regulator [Holophagales bacterium]